MDIEETSKTDRREYWREYQRKRYERVKIRMGSALKATPEEIAKYKETVRELGLTGQKNWRARKKLKDAMISPDLSKEVTEFIHKRAKASSVRRGIEFTLEPEHIVLVGKCPILGVFIEYHGIGERELVHKPSLDRIDNSKGYVPGNVQVVSARANVLKRDATLEELVQLGEWAKEQLRRR